MTKEEAIAILAEVATGRQALARAAEEDGTDCFWCCGGGDEWRAELDARAAEALTEHPELNPRRV